MARVAARFGIVFLPETLTGWGDLCREAEDTGFEWLGVADSQSVFRELYVALTLAVIVFANVSQALSVVALRAPPATAATDEALQAQLDAAASEFFVDGAYKLEADGEFAEQLFVHGLGVQTAEGMAEWLHWKIREDLGIPVTIVMPGPTPTVKVTQTEGHGATFYFTLPRQ